MSLQYFGFSYDIRDKSTNCGRANQRVFRGGVGNYEITEHIDQAASVMYGQNLISG
ncbi:hypothetical protein CBM2614_B160128 [Cupriavidus taiwanensis]|uniref:Uncharacterized protein n=1 Tax=Cupriavidus taiwanensis TaxID=164546 RepID=A0A976G4F5_9BURK|nr:hypothetical protein CBM2614_B160128 [Cupriavidus taiwanensis]SOZ68818.1 hypothetical protein CBM2613_B120124 [Cupriavidus taiwanensis]